jgi:hypothetical protein
LAWRGGSRSRAGDGEWIVRRLEILVMRFVGWRRGMRVREALAWMVS